MTGQDDKSWESSLLTLEKLDELERLEKEATPYRGDARMWGRGVEIEFISKLSALAPALIAASRKWVEFAAQGGDLYEGLSAERYEAMRDRIAALEAENATLRVKKKAKAREWWLVFAPYPINPRTPFSAICASEEESRKYRFFSPPTELDAEGYPLNEQWIEPMEIVHVREVPREDK